MVFLQFLPLLLLLAIAGIPVFLSWRANHRIAAQTIETPNGQITSIADTSIADTSIADTYPKRRNYFVRHWMGELSLPVSYWINGVLVNIVTTILAALAIASAFVTPYQQLILIGLLIGIVGSWQIVGIWRSATHRGGGWAIAAKVVMVFWVLKTITDLVQPTSTSTSVTNHGSGLSFQEQTSSDWLLLHLTGEIGTGDYLKFVDFYQRTVKQYPDKRPLITLNSNGGYVEEADKIATFLHDTKLIVAVGPKHQCVSACFILFAAAKERYVWRGASVGVHSLFDPLQNAESEAASAQTVKMSRALAQYGVPSQIIGKLIETNYKNVYYLNDADLQSMQVNIRE